MPSTTGDWRSRSGVHTRPRPTFGSTSTRRTDDSTARCTSMSASRSAAPGSGASVMGEDADGRGPSPAARPPPRVRSQLGGRLLQLRAGDRAAVSGLLHWRADQQQGVGVRPEGQTALPEYLAREHARLHGASRPWRQRSAPVEEEAPRRLGPLDALCAARLGLSNGQGLGSWRNTPGGQASAQNTVCGSEYE